MKKKKEYKNTKFQPEIISEASTKLFSFISKKHEITVNYSTRISNIRWDYDSEEEFFADYRQDVSNAHYSKRTRTSEGIGFFELEINFNIFKETEVSVEATARNQIEAVFEIFEKNTDNSKVQVKEEKKLPTVFIGHGRSEQWRNLKDHLHEKHDYPILAYEIAARAGHAIRDILEDMVTSSSFAILVMTGEDRDSSGKLHPRVNVIHELGLFQGALGFSKAIILLEEDVEEFSNIHGIHQIRYSKGKIKETFGEVLATLKQEFS